jgi:SAM-dependent methyltransferase
LGALEDLPEASFDLVWMGEVIEHVLNHPLGLMKAVRRAMKPDGLLILTTPNAANFMHMYRLFRGLSYIRDTEAFMSEPKFDAQGHIISHPGIHYHEYVPAEIDDLLRMAGFRLQERRYLPVGSSGGQPLLKRLVKQAYPTRRLLHTRLFGATQYCLARPAPPA